MRGLRGREREQPQKHSGFLRVPQGKTLRGRQVGERSKYYIVRREREIGERVAVTAG